MPSQNTPPSRHLLRQETLRQREALSASQRQQKSAIIATRLLDLAVMARIKTIFTYVNFRSEVETKPLIATWLVTGKKVCVPMTLAKESRLEAYEIRNLDKDLLPGYCQIPEPDATRLKRINPADIEAIILPGSVFDLSGGRLGYGGGYYDRFISQQAPSAIRIALAFELQLTNSLPLLAHDQKIHTLITEERVLHFA
ncbi:MAG: 5-formyltetrahydrofolate cyclo-ligase [Desulfobulbaceae bacterium]|nr:5-formyltetrahydrofolate cyclo-ligase [Desulfobulbaceae bacterium]